jgi:hypothetical protein
VRSDVQLVPGPPGFAREASEDCPAKPEGRSLGYVRELRLAGQPTLPIVYRPIFFPGAVAQLGERELCKLEVVGSIPIGSTSLRSRSEKGCQPDISECPRRNICVSNMRKHPKCPRMFVIFEIVKAGLAGLHNRLI